MRQVKQRGKRRNRMKRASWRSVRELRHRAFTDPNILKLLKAGSLRIFDSI